MQVYSQVSQFEVSRLPVRVSVNLLTSQSYGDVKKSFFLISPIAVGFLKLEGYVYKGNDS